MFASTDDDHQLAMNDVGEPNGQRPDAHSDLVDPTTPTATTVKPSEATPAFETDWDTLRELSLKPGGFGDKRASIWPYLLGVEPLPQPGPQDAATDNEQAESSSETECEVHPDEHQIKLDTDRSFVLYPVERKDDRETLQENLHDLLVQLFRKRRKLGYFQGYHDIITVIYLTVPPELRFACAEKISLHRVRDSMGSSLEPVLGLLRITKNLLRLADREYASTLERTSPLPFYALSNLLTLFSHDMPTLPLIQHVFDYLLCRPPIAVVYLTAVIILLRKEEVKQLELDGEEGMAHSLLSSLPDIEDEVEEDPEQVTSEDIAVKPPKPASPGPEVQGDDGTGTDASGTPDPQQTPESGPTAPISSPKTTNDPVLVNDALQTCSSSKDSQTSSPPTRSRSRSTRRLVDDPSPQDDFYVPSLPHTSRSPSRTKSPSPPPPDAPLTLVHTEEPHHPGKPKISLSELLKRADQLREEFPPDHPELGVAKIMGPQSVIFTWKQPRPPGTNVAADGEDTELGEDIIGDPDDAAEAMLLHPELVVYTYDPRSEEAEASKEGGDGDGDGDGDHLLTGSRKEKRKRRKLHKPRYKFDVRTKTIVAGSVIVLGVAMAAAYGMRAQKYGSAGTPFGTHGQKKWAQSQQWFSGAIVGAAMKLAQAFGGGENGRGEL